MQNSRIARICAPWHILKNSLGIRSEQWPRIFSFWWCWSKIRQDQGIIFYSTFRLSILLGFLLCNESRYDLWLVETLLLRLMLSLGTIKWIKDTQRRRYFHFLIQIKLFNLTWSILDFWWISRKKDRLSLERQRCKSRFLGRSAHLSKGERSYLCLPTFFQTKIHIRENWPFHQFFDIIERFRRFEWKVSDKVSK